MSEEKFELRYLTSDEAEIRVERDEDSGTVTLTGTAPPYGAWSGTIGGRFLERFEEGAFEGDDSDIVATHEHNDALLLGRASSGTLEIRDDEQGRHYRIQLPDTEDGRKVAVLAERGDLKGSSFEFNVREGGDEWDVNAEPNTRTIKRGGATMRQIGPVARPAYPQFGLALRSLERAQPPVPAETPKLEALRSDLTKTVPDQ